MLRALRFVVNYFVAWIPLWGIYFALIYYQGSERSLTGAFYGSAYGILSAAAIGLAVWPLATRLASRLTIDASTLVMHSVGAVLYATIWTGINGYSIRKYSPEFWPYFKSQVIGWHALIGIFLYAGLAAVAHLVESHRLAKAQREATERAEAMRAKAELAALRSQLNPHFLFNTLHSISALVRADPLAAEDAIERLAGLLRHVLNLGDRDADTISLAEEWELVSRQLELEQLRFGDRLRIVQHLDDDALECAVPILTLQPLVENAVRHGITPSELGGTIEVRAVVRSDWLEIDVIDDGVGMQRASASPGAGTGLRSVRQRLQSTCGPEATVTMSELQPRGTRVRMSLPAKIAPARPAAHIEEPVCAS